VLATARHAPAETLPDGVVFEAGDVSKGDDVVRIVARAERDLGGVDVLVNNAGIEIEKTIEDTTEDEWDLISKFGLIYAGAQKNLGPSGVTLVIVRKDLVQGGNENIPIILQYREQATQNSLSNTPPSFGIYILKNVLSWVKEQGGVSAVEKVNQQKADLLYSVIESRPDFYSSPVEKGSRSLMNVVFNLPTPELEAECIAAAQKLGMVGLKGHRSVGGMRASIYNAVPLASVSALADFLKSFKK
jgi:phosphoserine aminotransferase